MLICLWGYVPCPAAPFPTCLYTSHDKRTMPHIEHCPFFPLICHFYCIPKIGTLEVRFLNFWTSENRNVTILISTILSIVILNQSYQSYPKSFPCIMEMCITGYGAMDNSVHSTWKSKMQLSHILQTELPTTPYTASYTTFPQCLLWRNPTHPCLSYIKDISYTCEPPTKFLP